MYEKKTVIPFKPRLARLFVWSLGGTAAEMPFEQSDDSVTVTRFHDLL